MQQRGIPWNKVFLLSTHWDGTWIQASNWKISLSNCILIFWYLSISLVWDNRIHTHTQQKSKKSYWGNWQCIHYHVAMANITLTFFVVSFWRNNSCICKWGIQVRDESRQLCNTNITAYFVQCRVGYTCVSVRHKQHTDVQIQQDVLDL